jgi:hypothetical protein
MNCDRGELLREGIDRATTGERLGPGLAGRARQHHHRRALAVRAAAVTGTAAVAAAAVFAATIGAGGAPRPAGGGLPALTTAYVAGHTEQALATAGRGNLIERVRFAPPRGAGGTEADAELIGRKASYRLSSRTISGTTSWSYRGRTRTQGFTSGGQLAIDVGPSTVTRPSGPQPPLGTIAVDPNARKWFHPLRLPDNFRTGPLTCNQGVDWLAAGILPPAQLSALIRKALSCHLFRAAGRQRVDGINAVRLIATPRLARQIHGEARDLGPGVKLWVNPHTYLPVRLTLGPQGGTADFDWLAPTGANLARLRVRVPAGLHEVQLPARSLLLWADVSPAS